MAFTVFFLSSVLGGTIIIVILEELRISPIIEIIHIWFVVSFIIGIITYVDLKFGLPESSEVINIPSEYTGYKLSPDNSFALLISSMLVSWIGLIGMYTMDTVLYIFLTLVGMGLTLVSFKGILDMSQ